MKTPELITNIRFLNNKDIVKITRKKTGETAIGKILVVREERTSIKETSTNTEIEIISGGFENYGKYKQDIFQDDILDISNGVIYQKAMKIERIKAAKKK